LTVNRKGGSFASWISGARSGRASPSEFHFFEINDSNLPGSEFMTVQKIEDAQKEERRQKWIVVTLFTLGFAGLAYLVFDYVNIMNRTVLPEKLSGVAPAVEEWKAAGFVYAFDAKKSELIVDELKWQEKKREEKVGIVTQLARYCASTNRSSSWGMRVVGRRSSTLLGEIGQAGLVIN
jgi:hypothetical protein